MQNFLELISKNEEIDGEIISREVFSLNNEEILENREFFLNNFKKMSGEAKERVAVVSLGLFKRYLSDLLINENISKIKNATENDFFSYQDLFDEVMFLDDHQGDYDYLSPKLINLFDSSYQSKIFESKDSRSFKILILKEIENPLDIVDEDYILENFSKEEIKNIFKNKKDKKILIKVSPLEQFKEYLSQGIFRKELIEKCSGEDLLGVFYSKEYDLIKLEEKLDILKKVFNEDFFEIKNLDYKKKMETLSLLVKNNLYKIKEGSIHVKDIIIFDGKNWKYPDLKSFLKIENTPQTLKGEYNPYLDVFKTIDKEYSLDFVLDDEIYQVFKPNKWIDSIAQKKGQKYIVSFLKRDELKIQEFPSFNIQTERPFGFELEFCSKTPLSDIALALEAELSEEDPIQSRGYSWDVKPDPSLRSTKKFFSVEIASPKLFGEEGIKEICEKIKIIKEEFSEQVWVNKSCGIHVHHDISDLKALEKKKGEIIKELFKYQEVLFNECKNYRRDLSTSAPLVLKGGNIKEKDFKSKAQEEFTQHKGGFKVFGGYNQSTLEFRMMEASFDEEKISRWIRMTHLCVESLVADMKKEYDKQKEAAEKFLALSAKKSNNISDLIKAQDLLIK